MGGHEHYRLSLRTTPPRITGPRAGSERGQGGATIDAQYDRVRRSLEALILKYGEDNGRYLYEEMTRYRSQPAPLRQHSGLGALPIRPLHA